MISTFLRLFICFAKVSSQSIYLSSFQPGVYEISYFLISNMYYSFFFWPCQAACGILVPRPGIEPGPSAVKAPCPNHWTTREFPVLLFFKYGFAKSMNKKFYVTCISWTKVFLFKCLLSMYCVRYLTGHFQTYYLI